MSLDKLALLIAHNKNIFITVWIERSHLGFLNGFSICMLINVLITLYIIWTKNLIKYDNFKIAIKDEKCRNFNFLYRIKITSIFKTFNEGGNSQVISAYYSWLGWLIRRNFCHGFPLRQIDICRLSALKFSNRFTLGRNRTRTLLLY